MQQIQQNLLQMLQFLDLRQKIFAKSQSLYIYIILFLYTIIKKLCHGLCRWLCR